jgi:DNA primase small subunit
VSYPFLCTILQRPFCVTSRTALDYLKTIFPDLILVDQDCFASEHGYDDLLKLIPDTGLVRDLREAWSEDPPLSSQDKWTNLKSRIKKLYDKGSTQRVCFLYFVTVSW